MRLQDERESSGSLAYAALGVSIVLNAGALIFLRALVEVISSPGDPVTLRFFAAALGHWLLWAGGASFIVGVFFWVQSLKEIPLSVAYPTAAVSYVVIALVSRYLFDEPITAGRIVGMVMISAGVGLLYRRLPEPAR